jgi:hypothetical protein
MMKKILGSMLFITLLSFMLATEIQQTNLKPNRKVVFATRPNEQSRNVPNVEFVTEPVPLMENYYDYFPGGYNRTPMVLQPQTTNTGYPAGGLYIAFQARETAGSNRRVYFAYINSSGELVQRYTDSTNNVWEGFPAIAMDTITANPIIAYHRMSADNTYDCYMSYDLYHLLAAPGAWKYPFIAIDNPEAGQPHTGAIDDQFVFPRIAIGPSPNVGYSRCYILADNSTPNSDGFTGNNSIIGYADFDGDLMASQMELEFEYTTIPELDDLHYNNIARSVKDLVVTDDGQVALVGWYDTTFFIAHSSNYGENFTYYETNGRFDLWNPQNQDGNYLFESTPFAYPSPDGKNFNAIYSENTNRFLVFSTMSINTENAFEQGLYYPQFNYPKIYQFSIENGMLNVHVIDMHITGAYPSDGNPMVPWDLNEDGIPDEFDENGNVVIPLAFPSHFYSNESNTFPENGNFKLSFKSYWMAAIWQDSEKVYWHHQGAEGYEDWAEKPEILISVSNDYGNSWSQPAYLNAKEGDDNYYPQFSGMIPVYVYTANELEIIDENEIKLHLFFTDDYSYGSFVQGNGENLGSKLYYAAVNLEYEQEIEPYVEVSGYIADSNDPTNRIQDATVHVFNNYHSFQTQSDENGIFLFPEVPSMSSYQISISHPLYETYSSTFNVGTLDYSFGLISLNELILPPYHVFAALLKTGTVNISWDIPVNGQWLHYDNDINEGGFGSTLDSNVAIRYIPAQLITYDSWLLKKIRFFPCQSNRQYFIRVWSGENANNLLFEQLVHAYTVNSWNEVRLANPVQIDASCELWIGYLVINHGGNPFGYDSGPATAGYGDMINSGGTWVSAYQHYGINANWNIQGLVEYSSEKSKDEYLLPIYNQHEQTSHVGVRKDDYSFKNKLRFGQNDLKLHDRIREQYVIYRLIDGEQNNEAVWTEISTVSATENSYLDYDFPNLNNGAYRYAVKAVYTNNMFSQPTFSNILSIGMHAEVIVNVSTSSGDSPENALVTLTHDSNLPEFTYSMSVLENGTVIFPQVWKGIYTVDIQLAGFQPHHTENIDFSNDFSLYNVHLIESLTPINNLEWSIENHNVTLSWNEPSETIRNPLPLSLQSESNGRKSKPIIENMTTLKEVEHSKSVKKSNTRALLGYQVYRNGILISDVLQETVFTDSNVPNGSFVYGIEVIYTTGSSDIILTDEITITENDNVLTIQYTTQLMANIPNPFNPFTTIQFELAEAGEVSLEIFNLIGQKVRTLTNEFLPIGKHERIWNGKDNNEQSVASGIYFYKLRIGKYSAYRKMLLMK